MTPFAIAASLVVGLASGVASGLLGVSPGGALVVFSALLLGAEQHVAQGVSLIAQIAPTSLAGVRRYRDHGVRVPARWLILLGAGFLVGGVAGAFVAGGVSATALRWTYVAYLAGLDGLMILRALRGRGEALAIADSAPIAAAGLIAVGLAGGFASGFLGIGGGLAITAGLGAALKAPQRQAQMASLILSLVPTTAPAAYVYWRAGWTAPWPVIAAVIVGLWIGTDVGARLANQIGERTLGRLAIGFVAAMAIGMAFKAIG
jgi:uncharacterized membrane protein YfcA